jgi:hypothetical protein
VDSARAQRILRCYCGVTVRTRTSKWSSVSFSSGLGISDTGSLTSTSWSRSGELVRRVVELCWLRDVTRDGEPSGNSSDSAPKTSHRRAASTNSEPPRGPCQSGSEAGTRRSQWRRGHRDRTSRRRGDWARNLLSGRVYARQRRGWPSFPHHAVVPLSRPFLPSSSTRTLPRFPDPVRRSNAAPISGRG